MVGKWLVCLSVFCVCAHDVRIDLSLLDTDGNATPHVVAGVPFLVQVHVDGDSDHEPNIAHIKELPDCRRIRVGTQLTFVNGVSRTSKTYTYRCRVDQPGTLVLGPAFIDNGTQRTQSAAVSCPVVAATQQQLQQPAKDLELRVNVDRPTAYVGQQLLVHAQLLARAPIVRCALQDAPIAGAHMGHAFEPTQTKVGAVLHVDYRAYMYPDRPGTLTIPAMTVVCEQEVAGQQTSAWPFRAFFGAQTKTVHVQSAPVTVAVKSLPPSVRTPDGVGQFWEFSLRPSASQFSTARAATLTVTLAGMADFDKVVPQLHMPDGLRVYQSQVALTPDATRPGALRKTIEFVVQAVAPGTFTIGAQTFYFFDPIAGAYKTLKTAPFNVRVTGAAVVPMAHGVAPRVASAPVHARGAQSARDVNWLMIVLGAILFIFAVVLLILAGARWAPMRALIGRMRAIRRLRSQVRHAIQVRDCALLYQAWQQFCLAISPVPGTSVFDADIASLCALMCSSDEQKNNWHAYVKRMQACAYGRVPADDEFFKTSAQWLRACSWWRVCARSCILSRSSKLKSMK